MGIYQDIVNLIQNSVPEYTSLKIVPRGTPIFPDLLMTGQSRYARLTGSNFAVLNPDNQSLLTSAAAIDTQTLVVDRLLPWLEENALVTLNQTQFLQVNTWDTTTNTIYLNQSLSAAWAVGSPVTLWATPLVVDQDAAVGARQVQIRSRYQLANGDAICFPVSNILTALTQIDVNIATSIGIDGLDPNFPYIYVLDLAQPIPIAFEAETTSIYLRAFPSYISQVLNTPTLPSGQAIGPFLLDFVASPLDSIPSYPQTFSVRTIASGNTMVEGGLNYFKTVTPNYPIINRPIYAENMIFWDMIRSYGGFILPNRFRMVTESQMNNGLYAARVSTKLVPPLAAGITYNFQVSAQAAGTFVAIAYPYAPVVVDVPLATSTTVTIQTPVGGAPITRLDFLFKCSTANTQITISDSSFPSDPIVQQFQYAYVFRVLGSTNFQATSVIVKPYFLSLSDLTTTYDSGQTYNSGYIYT